MVNFMGVRYKSIHAYNEDPIMIRICFADLFCRIPENAPKATYTLWLLRDPKVVNNFHFNNFCWFSKTIVLGYLKTLQRIVPEVSKVQVTEEEFEGVPCYKVILQIEQAPKKLHKYALTWTRYLYESVFSFILNDALWLSRLPEYKFISLANLINVVTTSYPRGNVKFMCMNTWHGIGVGACENFYTNKELHHTLFDDNTLNSIYIPKAFDGPKPILKLEVEEGNAYTLDYWLSEEQFAKRKEVYKHNFDLMREGYKYYH